MTSPLPIKIAVMDAHVKFFCREIIGLGVFTLSVIAAWQEQAIFWAELFSYIFGGLAACYTIWGVYQKRKADQQIDSVQRRSG